MAESRASSAAVCSRAPGLPQGVQQVGHAARMVDGDVGGGPAGQRGGLLAQARLLQAVQQAGHAARVVAGNRNAWPASAAAANSRAPLRRSRSHSLATCSGLSGSHLRAATRPIPSAYPGNRTACGSLMPNTTIAR